MRRLLVVPLLAIALCATTRPLKAEYIDYGEPSEAEVRAWLNSLLPLSDAGWAVLNPWNGNYVVYISNRDTSRDGSVVSVRVRWEYQRDTDVLGIRPSTIEFL